MAAACCYKKDTRMALRQCFPESVSTMLLSGLVLNSCAWYLCLSCLELACMYSYAAQ